MRNYLLILLIVLFGLGACKKTANDNSSIPGSNISRSNLPNATGKAGEVVVVANEEKWNSIVGETVWSFMAESVPYIPQVEPKFNLVQIPKEAFSRIFRTHRNLIFIELDAKKEKASMNVYRDKWAYPQTIVEIRGKSYQEIKQLIETKGDALVDIFEAAERNRIVENYTKYYKKSIYDYLIKHHKLKLIIPKGYKLDVDKKEFLWFSHETSSISQGILIYRFPYTSVDQFEIEALIEKRDEFLKKYVPGPTEGSYMTTEKLVFPELRKFSLNGRFIAEMRGLWKVENDFMGGPFISYATVDEYSNEIVVVEGFVYAPQFKKRNYLRQVEAILYTIDFVKPDESID